jgi:hypothetical protein
MLTCDAIPLNPRLLVVALAFAIVLAAGVPGERISACRLRSSPRREALHRDGPVCRSGRS